jgi:hypothetical protein
MTYFAGKIARMECQDKLITTTGKPNFGAAFLDLAG